ncbi:chemotaxis protein CheA [Pullulanibacillus sp. KACC 23026]|uniref:chemotaxis protein CheA n=1 Tax=Pullulanibacillus sp. KACC 23026 TaxID=3028315 RepID=UPI0023AEDF4E|nr:chemotaxis protein CheA [Pullulanibacillus sp. KACC 23026]WEG11261.1 chemotaxis protein CheA [Pullulanibacillus sp. KACC 23026]
MDLNDYIDMFLEESKEHLLSINEELLKLESEPGNTVIVNEIFRSAHTLKGMAASMGFEDLASLTHQMENVLDLLRNEKLAVTPQIMDVIFSCVDLIEKMVQSIENGGDGKENVSDVIAQLNRIQDPSAAPDPTLGGAAKEVAATAAPELVMDEFQLSLVQEAEKSGMHVYQIKVRIAESCVMKSIRAYLVFQTAEELGEIIQTYPTVEEIENDQFGDHFQLLLLTDRDSEQVKSHLLNVAEVVDVQVTEGMSSEPSQSKAVEPDPAIPETEVKKEKTAEPANSSKKKPRSKSIRVDTEKLDHLMNLISELIIDRGRLEQIARDSQLMELTETTEHLSLLSKNLQEVILKMRMVPIEQVFNRFPRMIRDLAKELNKKVQLIVEGEETELDRTVIDEIGDPLVHLLRNALDHGLETTEERIESNKKEEGMIALKAFYSGNHVFIEVADDGKGIDRDKVLSKAIERQVVRRKEAASLSDQEVYALLFSSGFSTADKISDISGRGVGLDVVKSKIESIGGAITINSTPGRGSTFRIQLPLSLSIIMAMLIEIGEESYFIPLNSIAEITSIVPESIITLHGQKVFQLRDQIVPLIYLEEVFGTSKTDKKSVLLDEVQIVIIRNGNQIKGLVVDAVLGQHEVVLKSLGHYLTRLHAISGATILGSGEVALIVDTQPFFD